MANMFTKLKSFKALERELYKNRKDVKVLQKVYKLYAHAINQQMREKEKAGTHKHDPLYKGLVEKGYVGTKGKAKGKARISEKLSPEDTKSYTSFIKKFEFVYNIKNKKSYRNKKQKDLKEVADEFAKVGIDIEDLMNGTIDPNKIRNNMSIDEMMANPQYFTDELNYFWDLYHAAVKSGIFDEFGISSIQSEVRQEYIKTFLDNFKFRPAVREVLKEKQTHFKDESKNYTYHVKEHESNAMQRAARAAERERADAPYNHNGMRLEAARFLDYRANKSKEKLNNMTDAILYHFTEKSYGDIDISQYDLSPEDEEAIL